MGLGEQTATDTESVSRTGLRVGAPSDSPSLVSPTQAPSKKERQRDSNHRNYMSHREQRIENSHQYYMRNRERILANARNYGITHRKQIHEYYIQHRNQRVEAARNYRTKHPERLVECSVKHYRALKIKVLNMIGGAECVNCGTKDIRILEVNHINGGGAKEASEYRKRGTNLYTELAYGRRTTAGLNVLCRVCNALDHVKRKYPDLADKYKVVFNG